jgi:hypothetical protein
MSGLLELQIALTRMWIRYCASVQILLLSVYAPNVAEQKAAACAMRELDHIVRAHSAKQRHRA